MQLGLNHREQLRTVSNLLVNDLDEQHAVITTWADKEHHDDGSHGAITADSLTVTGDVVMGGSLTVSGATISDLRTVGIVMATADESVNNNTLQNDNELFFAGVANATYAIIATVFFSAASTTPDASWNFTIPAGATITTGAQGYDEVATIVTNVQQGHRYRQNPMTVNNYGVMSSQTASMVLIHGTVKMGATAGTIQFRWAQFTTTAGTPTIRKADSWLQYIRTA